MTANPSISGSERLINKLIDSLQNWYGKAIRENNGDYCATRKAMCASLCHRASTDENPRHEFCPNDGVATTKLLLTSLTNTTTLFQSLSTN